MDFNAIKESCKIIIVTITFIQSVALKMKAVPYFRYF